ncbi:MAG: transcriptional regulator [Salinirussus sp.]
MDTTALDRILEEFRTQSALARALGLKQQSVQEWFATGRIPASRCVEIELLTDGRIRRSEIRPDIFGSLTEVRSQGESSLEAEAGN